MKAFIALLLLVCLVAATASTYTVHQHFQDWTKLHNKKYETLAETVRRFEIFKANAEYVKKHNAEAAEGKHSYVLGTNHLADLTVDEYRAQLLSYRRSNLKRPNNNVFKAPAGVVYPDEVDWRTKGAVTDVKDQGQCGSCWSFSTTGAIEGAHALATGDLVSLSEQNLVDCVSNGSFTCDTGGEMQVAFQYVIDNGGIEGEADYPYCTCSGNTCQYDSSLSKATISSYKAVAQGSESDLLAAAAGQPVSIAIDASSQNFQLYSGGVFDLSSCSSSDLDHGVLIAGYGSYNGKAYWLVKNSWSANWGLSGYIMMSRNKNNQCGVATDASFPIV